MDELGRHHRHGWALELDVANVAEAARGRARSIWVAGGHVRILTGEGLTWPRVETAGDVLAPIQARRAAAVRVKTAGLAVTGLNCEMGNHCLSSIQPCGKSWFDSPGVESKSDTAAALDGSARRHAAIPCGGGRPGFVVIKVGAVAAVWGRRTADGAPRRSGMRKSDARAARARGGEGKLNHSFWVGSGPQGPNINFAKDWVEVRLC